MVNLLHFQQSNKDLPKLVVTKFQKIIIKIKALFCLKKNQMLKKFYKILLVIILLQNLLAIFWIMNLKYHKL